MRKEDVDRVERDREEMVCQEAGRGSNPDSSSLMMEKKRTAKRAYPDRRETGPLIHSPPHSKYLKHPVRRTASSSSRKNVQ